MLLPQEDLELEAGSDLAPVAEGRAGFPGRVVVAVASALGVAVVIGGATAGHSAITGNLSGVMVKQEDLPPASLRVVGRFEDDPALIPHGDALDAYAELEDATRDVLDTVNDTITELQGVSVDLSPLMQPSEDDPDQTDLDFLLDLAAKVSGEESVDAALDDLASASESEEGQKAEGEAEEVVENVVGDGAIHKLQEEEANLESQEAEWEDSLGDDEKTVLEEVKSLVQKQLEGGVGGVEEDWKAAEEEYSEEAPMLQDFEHEVESSFESQNVE